MSDLREVCEDLSTRIDVKLANFWIGGTIALVFQSMFIYHRKVRYLVFVWITSVLFSVRADVSDVYNDIS